MFLTIAIVTGYKQSMGNTDVKAAAQDDTAEEMASKSMI